MTLSLPPLPPDSEAFRVIQYQLQQQLNAVRVRIVEAFDITSITQSQLFSNFCQTINPINVIHAFIPTSDLQQPISDIATRGIRVNPKRGFRFRADKIVVDSKKSVIEVVHCLVALGNTQNFMSFKEDLDSISFLHSQVSSDALNEGYNSLCVSESNEYVIFNPDQIRSLQFIRFTGGEALENASELGTICDVCQDAQAVCWCNNCSAKLCQKCDHSSHSANRLLQSHSRISLEEAKPLMETCPFHPGVRVDHFCPECQLPVCIECKMSGHHSRGPQLMHQLVPLKDAYYSSLRAGSIENRIYSRRRHILHEKLIDSEARMKDVIDNAKSLEARIMKIANEAIASLHEQAAERALIIASTQTEIKRKLTECESKSNFIKEHMKYSSPLTTIRAITIHDKVVNELRPDNDLPRGLAVEGDLVLTGILEVKSKRDTVMPIGVKNRDVYFDERNIRNVDYPSQTFDSNTVYASQTQTYSQMSETGDPIKERGVAKEEGAYSTMQSQNNTETQDNSQYQPQPAKSLIRVITLTQMAMRKEQKLLEQNIQLGFVPFEGSAILTNETIARRLYMCMPFRNIPQAYLLYSTERDGRFIKNMHQCVDNVGITVVIVKRKESIFGGFAAAKWNSDGQPFGDRTSCFLFSINKDVFIPYRPRVSDACFLYATPSSITFGKYDLVLSNNFNTCIAQIEKSYGVGLPEGSKEARTFFLDEEEFPADIVEVWGFFTVDQ